MFAYIKKGWDKILAQFEKPLVLKKVAKPSVHFTKKKKLKWKK